jgi:hypothetical protein
VNNHTNAWEDEEETIQRRSGASSQYPVVEDEVEREERRFNVGQVLVLDATPARMTCTMKARAWNGAKAPCS